MGPHLQTTVWTLISNGAGQREIERATGVSRHTIRAYQKRYAIEPANCSEVATGLEQFAPPRPRASPAVVVVSLSACEPHREFVEAQLRLRRNTTAICQDLVDHHGFAGAYGAAKQGARRRAVCPLSKAAPHRVTQEIRSLQARWAALCPVDGRLSRFGQHST